MADTGAPTPLSTKLSIAPFNVELLDADPATICALDRDHRIIYVNRAWREFGRTNGCAWSATSWTRGVSLPDTIPPVLRDFYVEIFARARVSDAPVTLSYECSTPTTFRQFYMQVFRCDGGALLVVHSLAREAPMTRTASEPLDALYRDADGLISMCSHCRRVQHAERGESPWDWVPAYVANIPPGTSHSLCPLCVSFFFSS